MRYHSNSILSICLILAFITLTISGRAIHIRRSLDGDDDRLLDQLPQTNNDARSSHIKINHPLTNTGDGEERQISTSGGGEQGIRGAGYYPPVYSPRANSRSTPGGAIYPSGRDQDLPLDVVDPSPPSPLPEPVLNIPGNKNTSPQYDTESFPRESLPTGVDGVQFSAPSQSASLNQRPKNYHDPNHQEDMTLSSTIPQDYHGGQIYGGSNDPYHPQAGPPQAQHPEILVPGHPSPTSQQPQDHSLLGEERYQPRAPRDGRAPGAYVGEQYTPYKSHPPEYRTQNIPSVSSSPPDSENSLPYASQDPPDISPDDGGVHPALLEFTHLGPQISHGSRGDHLSGASSGSELKPTHREMNRFADGPPSPSGFSIPSNNFNLDPDRPSNNIEQEIATVFHGNRLSQAEGQIGGRDEGNSGPDHATIATAATSEENEDGDAIGTGPGNPINAQGISETESTPDSPGPTLESLDHQQEHSLTTDLPLPVQLQPSSKTANTYYNQFSGSGYTALSEYQPPPPPPPPSVPSELLNLPGSYADHPQTYTRPERRRSDDYMYPGVGSGGVGENSITAAGEDIYTNTESIETENGLEASTSGAQKGELQSKPSINHQNNSMSTSETSVNLPSIGPENSMAIPAEQHLSTTSGSVGIEAFPHLTTPESQHQSPGEPTPNPSPPNSPTTTSRRYEDPYSIPLFVDPPPHPQQPPGISMPPPHPSGSMSPADFSPNPHLSHDHQDYQHHGQSPPTDNPLSSFNSYTGGQNMGYPTPPLPQPAFENINMRPPPYHEAEFIDEGVDYSTQPFQGSGQIGYGPSGGNSETRKPRKRDRLKKWVKGCFGLC